MSMAQQAAMAATVPSGHIDRVVNSVTDATKRLSQISSSTTNTTTQSSKRRSRDTIGPWKLGKTLGKGSSGRVRLAKNMETGKLAAVKIVPKAKSSRPSALPYGIEREIIIMKLISHPNVMGLYEVWENKFELFLVLEYVDGGELFDYLVSRGRLPEIEAIHYFRQIIEGTAYCHGFNICHRDLKPENLLLDKKNKRIKIADFGMAALQTSNRLLETSCGSPHYASPEIVMGKSYNGGPSDVWSCGIILFALLTGHLPFNDDNIKRLLLKVQSGNFQMPQAISAEAKDLLSKILVVDPQKRLSINEILIHPLLTKRSNKRSKSNSDLHILNHSLPHIETPKNEKDVDPTILQNLQILWHGAPKEFILRRLLDPNFTEEKTFYSLLLAYQQRQLKQSQAQATSTISAPKIMQKSQFSVPSIKSKSSAGKEHVASSSRIFKSRSKKAIHVSASKKSLHSSSSKKSLTSLATSISKKAPKLSLQDQPLPSKMSLYSLNSISKRSVNLKDHLHEEEQPPLPKQSEFENICEEILFGTSLSNETEDEQNQGTPNTSQETLKIAQSPLKAEPKTSVAPFKHEETFSQVEKKPLPQVSKLKLTPSSRDLRITSAPSGKESGSLSLDPRRNVSQPNSIEMLLNKYSLRAHLKSKTNLKKMRNSGNWEHEEMDLKQASRDFDYDSSAIDANGTKEFMQNQDSTNITNVLAHSSVIKAGNQKTSLNAEPHAQNNDTYCPTSLSSAKFNSSTTFKNLKQFLPDGENTTTRASSVVHRPVTNSVKINNLSVSRKSSAKTFQVTNFAGQRLRKMSTVSNFDGRSDLLSDMSFAMDIPMDTFTAQAFHITNEGSTKQAEHAKRPVLLQEELLEDDINIFEDAACDNASVATSSSGLDSQPHVHRKATSIDTLNTTSVLTPTTDVRVSLYANNMVSSAKLPRETTEEIISKFRLSPEKASIPPQKRFSYQRARDSLSQSVMSMFKDLDDDENGDVLNENYLVEFKGIDEVHDLPRDASGSLNEAVLNKEQASKKRVTMLFDDETGNVFKSSPVKGQTTKLADTTATNQNSSITLPKTFTKSKLDPVEENVSPVSVRQQHQPLRPAPPPPSKETWFAKFIRTITPGSTAKEALIRDHQTKLEFEDVHIVMLREFSKHSIDYKLKRLDRRGNHSRADYNCRFVQGQFRFKIHFDGNSKGTNIHIKKKGQQDKTAFEKFNDDVSRVLKMAESKT
ncbi:LANO_0D06326g1_1 [Lachancea nothofagi CBS 11611]|uniref:non-specific serine/threonine protein kinase n=1 Tax=Lachancea nothofagi CBS 11611 TaxID=1266666 RepID=A0A1G4JHB8_9SACH|nr:LANO_0D06326g1_1 [Lachancea nothofagi CBS 11611]